MSNGSRFNTAGFNASTSSLVLVSAAAAFTATATADFTGGGFAVQAQVTFTAGAQTNFPGGLKTSLLSADLVSSSDNYFDPSVTYSAAGAWTVQTSQEFNPTADFAGDVAFVPVTSLSANTDFREGAADFVSNGSTLVGIANRVDFAKATYAPTTSLINDLDPQINGLMTGDWVATGNLWAEATVDRGLGYIAHEGYGFFGIQGNWENTSFLTELFTTGGFIGATATLNAEGTRVTNASSVVWPSVGNLAASPINTHAGSLHLTNSSQIELNAVRKIYPTSANWVGRMKTFTVKALMKYTGKMSVTTKSTLTGTTKMRRAGRLPMTHTATLVFGKPVVWQLGKVAAVSNATLVMKAQKVRPAVMALSSQVQPVFKSEKLSLASMDLGGFGATVTIAGALRLVDAPLSRQFRVPAQNRTFIVPAKANKFEVAP